MAYKRKAKQKEDLRKTQARHLNGQKYLEMGSVMLLENRFYDNSEKNKVTSMNMKKEVKFEDRDTSTQIGASLPNCCWA